MFDITVLIPVRNEAEALPKVLIPLQKNLQELAYEIIVLDDGDDDLEERLNCLRLENITYIHRPPENRNGLSGAIITGIALSDSRYVAIMDGDGQHPPKVIRQMYDLAFSHHLDMVMASRYRANGMSNGLDGSFRKFYSSFLRQIPRLLFPKLRRVTDPLGGCLLINLDCVHLNQIRAIGWKISLELLVTSSISTYDEVSYEFQRRIGGQSKANFKIGILYFKQLISLVSRHYFPLKEKNDIRDD